MDGDIYPFCKKFSTSRENTLGTIRAECNHDAENSTLIKNTMATFTYKISVNGPK
jgi:hypothetical protein